MVQMNKRDWVHGYIRVGTAKDMFQMIVLFILRSGICEKDNQPVISSDENWIARQILEFKLG